MIILVTFKMTFAISESNGHTGHQISDNGVGQCIILNKTAVLLVEFSWTHYYIIQIRNSVDRALL